MGAHPTRPDPDPDPHDSRIDARGRHASRALGPHEAGHDVDPTAHIDFVQVQRGDRFRTLRRTHRSFVFPMAAAFLIWYFLYVLLADYAHGFMSIRIVGNITVGLAFGLLQFVSTFAITMGYVAYANRRLDPLAADLREELEGAHSPFHRADGTDAGTDADADAEPTFDGDVDELAHRDSATGRPVDGPATRTEGDEP